MAKQKKTNVKIDPNLVDYYALYNLTRGTDRKTNLKALRAKAGDIKKKMSAGALNSEEIMAKLREQEQLITEAIRVFKSQEELEKYNEMLDAAVETGVLNTVVQQAAKDALEEIERLFMKDNYGAVIKLCRQTLSETGANSRVYYYLVQSYYLNNQADASIQAVDEYIRNFPKEGTALDLGVRYYIMLRNDFNKAQEYMNRILEIDEKSPLAVLDQSYIYLAGRNYDMAFSMVDEYIQAHPADQEFRRASAYDMIAFCSRMYQFYTVDGDEVAFLTSAEDQQACKKMADKAASIYQDNETRRYAEYTDFMGKEEFNKENLSMIGWSLVAGIIYCVPIFVLLFSKNEIGMYNDIPIIVILPFLLLAAGCFVIAGGLFMVSNRPYWQIYKYEVTGKREPLENIFVTLGSILSAYLRWSIKAGWGLVKFAFRLAMG